VKAEAPRAEVTAARATAVAGDNVVANHAVVKHAAKAAPRKVVRNGPPSAQKAVVRLDAVALEAIAKTVAVAKKPPSQTLAPWQLRAWPLLQRPPNAHRVKKAKADAVAAAVASALLLPTQRPAHRQRTT
jgi:hypothetical protein